MHDEARAPDVNVRAERAKPCGLESSPEGASPFQHGGLAPCESRPILSVEEALERILPHAIKMLRGVHTEHGEEADHA